VKIAGSILCKNGGTIDALVSVLEYTRHANAASANSPLQQCDGPF
jgi:hypothetical protein